MRCCPLLAGWPILFSMALLSGCEGSGGTLLGPVVPVPPPGAFDTAPDSLVVDGIRYDVEVTLWRDFMPISPPEGRGLAAAVLIRAPAGKTVPPELRPYWIWVRNKEDVWGADLKLQSGTPPGEMRLWAGFGPLWGPGVRVDVLLGRPGAADELHLVAVREVLIERSD